MRLSQSESVVGRKKGQKSRNNSKAKKKHKRLDAICEKAYNRNHAEVKMGDSTEVNNGGNESELRRSSRHRRAPALLDTSPLPPKKRQKVGRSGDRNVEKGNKGAKREAPYSSSRDLGGENSGWGARLRSRRENTGLSGNEEGVQPARGKRKLFEDLDGAQDDAVCPNDDKKEELVGDKATVVKLKRPGRVKTSIVVENEEDDVKASTVVENEEEDIKAFTVVENEEEDIKASTVVENEEEDIDFGGKAEDDEGKDMNVAVKVINEGGGLPSEMRLECGGDNSEKEDSPLGATMETAVQKVPELEDFSSNGNLVKGVEQSSRDRLQCDSVPDQRETVKIDPAMDNQLEDEGDKARDDGQHAKPGEIEKEKELKEKCSAIHAERKRPMIKLGRRCGLCGGGTDGKPPKILVVEGACSDNDAEGGSSASDEPNYDVWDGFGDQPGWLGRLLGPINDRFGIAGIWVHQHCAVWSPEVYFAGLGHLKNIRAALYRGRVLKCSRCGRPGATIGCRVDRCPKTYHLPCARSESCIFDHRKFLIACTDHRHLFQPHGIKKSERLKKMRAKKFKLEFRKTANDAFRKDIEAEDKWLEKCGEDEEFLKRESKRLHRDLCRIAPTYIGGANSSGDTQFQGWESVAGLEDVIQCMKEVVILPLLYPEYFSNLGLTPPRGVLLHGYPGTGKTLAVRALVGSCARGERRIAYFARKGADCLGKYVGDAERQLRLLFQVAERSQPSIIFFDEIDGLAPCRSKRQDQTHNSVVSTLLALMDGLNSRGSVIVIGATNRPDAVDSALRRPGRFDREIHFPLPSMKDREAILSLHTQKWPKPISGSLLTWVAKRTLGFAGADLQALCTQAAINALRRNFPLQKVLAEAGATSSCNNFPSIPTFVVEEKDWLKAISCAPPPCSRRESGIVLNDVLSSPLETHLVPCLLQPLTKLLVSLYLDERVWLPLSLNRCIKLVKNVIVSALESRKMQSDSWWSHIDDLLQDVDVTNEIVKNLLVSNVLTGESNLYGPSLMEENTDAAHSKSFSSKWQHRGSYSRLQQNTPQPLSDKPGFQMLISGDSQCGQRHFASCLLHCFLGNVNIWKVDMASISHEGHGDLVHGLTRILMRCAGAKLCMLFMPAIELWAFESYEKSPDDDCESSSIERHASREQTIFSHTAVKKASYLWTSFIEQVESVRINTSLIVLATSALPVSFLPDRIKQFFGDEMAHNQLKHKVPRFLVQLDRKFDYDEVVNCFAADFSKNLAQHFVQSLHGKDHDHEDWIEKKWYHIAEGDVSKVCLRKSDQPSPSSLVPETNKMLKRKSSLSLAISAVGYQILCYPHFAELCWVTSKLKEGPCTSVSGPWRGWPFNSCIVRPVKSSEKVDANTSDSGTIKSKEPGFVRGIVAVGLSAYRGEYTSLREVSSEIQKVSETLSRRIDAKFQAGKDKSLFIRFLSQMAHLEDMVNSWAHNLQRLEVDNGVSENANNCTEVLDQKPPTTSSVISQGLEVTENVHGETNTEDDAAIHSVEEPPQKVVLDINHNLKHGLASNEANLESPRKGNDQHDAETESPKPVKLLNGLAENIFNTQESYGPCDGPNDHVLELPPFAEESDQHNGLSFADNNVLAEKTTEEKDRDANYSSESSVTCFYQCCSECVINLKNLVLRILHIEKGHKASDLTIEELHDSLSSFSANLHLALSQLSPGEFSHMRREVAATKYLTCCRYQRVDTSECEIPDKLLITVCDCHDMNEQEKNSRASQDLVLKFVFKDGILVASDTTGTSDISYHCKFEKVCLCFLIEWLATMKDFS